MWSALRTPVWVSRIVSVVGLLAVVSALSPVAASRLSAVTEALPPLFAATATTSTAATGAILVALSRGLRRAKRRAWLMATVLTAATIVGHLVKGLDVEEAAISAAVLLLLVGARSNFTGRADPRSRSHVAVAAVGAFVTAVGIGFAWLEVERDAQPPGTSHRQRLLHALLGVFGIRGPVRFESAREGHATSIALVALGVAVVLVVILLALRTAPGPVRTDTGDYERLRVLVKSWGHIDSLSYFALRADRAVVFSKTGKAAVTYRVLGGVSLAAGDPIGDPEAWPGAVETWLAQAATYSWIPAVLGASETGAHAYRRAGLDALELGDEAVLDTQRFSLEGRSMRAVRQAVARCRRAGYAVSCARVADLDPAIVDEVRVKADQWRDGEVERGFSMALGRLAAAEDPEAVLVQCRDDAGGLRGILFFVPWGNDGLSLDLMRRDRDSENGLVEYMVTSVCQEADRLGVSRLSLNFAVLRSVFARGERIGAGPVLRIWHRVLLGLSRFWQIESLYRANAKYQPTWYPRFLCFANASDLPRVASAALRAEAFITRPRWLRRSGPR